MAMKLLIASLLLTALSVTSAQSGTTTNTLNFTGVTGVDYSNPLRGQITQNYDLPITTVVINGNSDLVQASLFSVDANGLLTANLSKYFDPSIASVGQVSIQVPTGTLNSISSSQTQISTAGNLSVSGTAVNPKSQLKVSITGSLVQIVNATSDQLNININQRNPSPRLLFQAVGTYNNVQYEGGPFTYGVISGSISAVNVTMYTGSGLNISSTASPTITGSYSTAFPSENPGGYLYYDTGSCNVPAQSGSLPNGETTPCMQTANVGGTIPPPNLAG